MPERYKARLRRESNLAARAGGATPERRQRPVPAPETEKARNIRKIHTWLRLGRGRNYIAAVPRDMREIVARMLVDCNIECIGGQTTEKYTMFGVQHNPYGPAYVGRGFAYNAVYYSYGVMHRVYGPAIIYRSPSTTQLAWYIRGQPKRPHDWPNVVEWYNGGCTAKWMPEGRMIQMQYDYVRDTWDEILTDGDVRTITDPMTGITRRAETGGIFQMIPGG